MVNNAGDSGRGKGQGEELVVVSNDIGGYIANEGAAGCARVN